MIGVPIEEALVESHAEQEALHQARVYTRLLERDGLVIGIAGSHGTGKSTICELLARDNPGVKFIRTSTKEIAAKHGFNVNGAKSFDERLTFQEAVLDHHLEIWSDQRTAFFTDRTPLDFAAYLLSDAPAGEIDGFTDLRISHYLARCAKAIKENFMTCIAIQPGIPYVPMVGRPAPNMAFQEKINALVIGLGRSMKHERRFYVLDRGLTDLVARVQTVAGIVNGDLKDYRAMLSWMPQQ